MTPPPPQNMHEKQIMKTGKPENEKGLMKTSLCEIKMKSANGK
jgi:hypothetical protein